MSGQVERSGRIAVPAILLIGTLDTKGPEIEWTAKKIEELGGRALILDSGVAGTPSPDSADFRREEVAAAGGTSLRDLERLPRGDAVGAMAEGVRAVTRRLVAEKRIDGALCIGGAAASVSFTAFQELPLGFPKLIVTPLASGSRQFEAFVGTSDVATLHSVADIMGVNAITKPIFLQAAGYILGAASAVKAPPEEEDRATWGDAVTQLPLVGATMNGNTTPALMRAREMLRQQGFELVTFHANGVGGRAMERLMQPGTFSGILDYTTTELAGHQIGGLMDAGPARMEVAGKLGIPQVLVPGCLDLITTGTYEETRAAYPGRLLYPHNPKFTLVRLTRDEMIELAHSFARKANASLGPTAVCIPLGGFSVPNKEGGPFWDPEADMAFVETLGREISPTIKVELVDAHINDDAFIERAISLLLDAMGVAATARGELVIEP